MLMNYKLKYRLEFLMKYMSVSRVIYNKLERGLLPAYKTPQNMGKTWRARFSSILLGKCMIVYYLLIGSKFWARNILYACAKFIESTFEIYMLLM